MRRAGLMLALLLPLTGGCGRDSPSRAEQKARPAEPSVKREPLARPGRGGGTEPVAASGTEGGARLHVVNGCRVLELRGSPEQMGRAHGRLLGPDIRRVVEDVLSPVGRPARWSRILAGTRVMERHQPERFRVEMRALAEAAGVEYLKIVALQLFGDAERAMPAADRPSAEEAREPEDIEKLIARGAGYQCTSYAVFGPATRTGECIVGRNFDYWYQVVARYASIIIHYRPRGRRRFVTLTWAGVVNGWTLMNDAGICAANNLAYGVSNSLNGVSTCFLQRLVVEEAGTVEEGIAVARKSPRAVGTAMLIAGGSPPDAVQIEFDHESFHVRRAHEGFVIADNSARALGRERPLGPEEGAAGRYGTLLALIKGDYGRIDRAMNFAAAPGVALEGMNLHSALFFPADLTFAVAMGEVPACRQPFRRFRMTAEGVVSAEKE